MIRRAHQPVHATGRRRVGGWAALGLFTPVGVSIAAHAVAAGVFLIAMGPSMEGPDDPPISSALLTLPLHADGERAPAPPPDVPDAPTAREASDAASMTTPGAGLTAMTTPLPSDSALAPEVTTPALGAPRRALSSALGAREQGVSFAGLSATGERARSVVYVVDASGPMVTSLPWVVGEVRRSVDALAPTQRFGVVLFRDTGEGASVVTFDARLNDANQRQRLRLSAWLDGTKPGGRSNPLDGLRAAFAMRPQVIFLLSRSIARSGGGQWGEGLNATLQELDRLNPVDPSTGQRRVIIKTIQFLEPDPTGTMQAISRAHGGGEASMDDRVIARVELGQP